MDAACSADDLKTSKNLNETSNNIQDEDLTEGFIKGVNGVQKKIEKQLSLQDLFVGRKKIENKILHFQRNRSNSDGARISRNQNADAFPSLPNSVLEKLGLHGDGARERLTEESLEKKFTSLALAFSIDATTIKDRCERQMRSRDRTESNFNMEVEKLKDKLALLKPLCVDVETADLLSTLFSQVETLTNAASLVSIAAERFGAVQHEERLTESVQLMVGHVQALKQQRDSARRQLQYTKKVLQEPIQDAQNNIPKAKKLISKRRASADAANLNQQSENFKLNRRISDISFRATLSKSRPSRLDLGMELNKIKEVSLDENKGDIEKPEDVPEIIDLKEDIDADLAENSQISTYLTQCDNNHYFNDIRIKFSSYKQTFQKLLIELFKKWSQNGYLHAFLNCCAILCFSISILTLGRIFLEEQSTYWLFNWKNKE